MCVGWLAAMMAAPWLCAQSPGSHSKQNGAPVADQFVSTPGQMVTTPGQRVNGPGQMVTTPGRMVIPPGQMVFAPGQSISPAPGVITPFHPATPSQSSEGWAQGAQTGGDGVTPGRRFQERHRYRPEYGAAEGYAVPHAVNTGYASGVGNGSATGVGGRAVIGVGGASGFGEQRVSPAEAPSGNRPAYRPGEEAGAESGPDRSSRVANEIQRQEPVLTVVMKNGERRKVRNYALTPKTLLDLDEAASGREVAIPLNKVNLAATEKAAAQAGLNFAVPTS